MSREEHPEDRKLLAVKSWFARSVSSISSQNGSFDAAADGNSSSISVSKEGAIEGGAGLTPLRQLSMRRSRPSGEIEKETGASSPSMTPRNITPLTPLTPLRWKSNPREQEEEEKAMERSRFGSAGLAGTSHEEYNGSKPAANYGKEERAAEGQQQGALGAGATALDRTKSVDDVSTTALAGNLDENGSPESPEGLDRKPSSGDDVMTMTIEFLRARLLSERSASKAAKLRVQQLATKVSELEQKLDQAIEDRKKAEVAAKEAVMKLKLAESSNQVTDKTSVEVSDRSISNSTKGSPLSRVGREDVKYSHQDLTSNEDLSRTNSYGSSVEDRDSSTKKHLPETVIKIEERTAEQGRPGVSPTLQDVFERSQESPQKQDSRAAIEIRLRNMWDKISAEMTALAEERSEEAVVRDELMSWMGQIPAVLQDIIPKNLVRPNHDVQLRSETGRNEAQGVPRQMVENHPGATKSVQEKGQPQADSKRAALLHEQFTAQETMQREWERNYQESQRKLELLKVDDLNTSRSPTGSAGHRGHGDQDADRRYGANGVADNSSFLGSHHARLAKSKSALDLPTGPNEYSSDMNSPLRDGPYVESDSWNGERPPRHATGGRLQDPGFQNASAHRHMPLDATHLNHGRMQQDRHHAPSMLQEAGHEAWPEKQLDQEAGLYYQETGNRVSRQDGYAEGSLPNTSHWPSTHRSAEDGYRSSQPDFRAGQPTWDDTYRGNSERHQQAQPGYGDANSRMERDSYYRDSEREESYSSSQPGSAHHHRHRRSHSDNYDWPAVEDYGLLNQQPEPSPGLGRRQSYSGYTAAMASDPSRASFEKASGSYDDPRHSDERMYGARGQRRDSFPAAKADNASGQQYSTRNGYSSAEPTLSLGYGPAYDAPREGSPVQQSPKAGSNKNINDVLRALQMAKANIQSGGAGSKDRRPSGEQASPRTGNGNMEPSAQYMQAPGQPTSDQFIYLESQAPLMRNPRPAFHNAKYDPYEADIGRERYQSENDVIPGTNANSSYVDQLNVGKGIQFFFP